MTQADQEPPKAPNHGPLGVHHPAFRPRWRRMGFVGMGFFWSWLEFFVWDAPLFGVLVLMLSGWLAYQMLWCFPEVDDAGEAPEHDNSES